MNNFIKMDYTKLFQYYQNSQLTDLLLTLNDGINILHLKVHKLILSLAVPFFEKQFAFSIEDKIILNVDNAFIANDLIMSFYGQKMNCGKLENWFHLLKTFQLRDYFGLENDNTLLSNLTVPSNGFDLFLEVCELVGFTDDIIKTINKNLPNDYDCFNLSKDLLNEMIGLENNYSIISVGYGNCINKWNMRTGDLINNFVNYPNSIVRVDSVNISSDNKWIVSDNGRDIIINDANTGDLINKFSESTYVVCVSFSQDNKLIASGGYDKTINVWNIQTGKLINTLIGHNGHITSVVFSPDNQFIVSGSRDQTIKIWDAKNYQLINTLNHTNIVLSLSISSDSKRIVSGSDDRTIKIWNIENVELIKSYLAHDSSILCVQFSPNNDKIISGSSDKTIKIWDANNYQLIDTLKGHTKCVNSIIFTPDSKFIISGSSDGNIKIWDAINYQLINTIKSPNAVNSITISNTADNEFVKKLKKYI